MRDADLAASLRRIADRLDDNALLKTLLAHINPYTGDSVSTNAELATAMKAIVRTLNDWRRRHNIVGGVVAEGVAVQDANHTDHYLELAAFKSAEERLVAVRGLVDAVLNETTAHAIALEEGTPRRDRADQERRIGDQIGEIWRELARVRLLMRESDD